MTAHRLLFVIVSILLTIPLPEHARKPGYLDLAYAEYQKALVRFNQGRLEEAIARIEGAIGMGVARHKADALFHLAVLLHVEGRDERALSAIEQGQTCTGPCWLHGRLLRLEILHSLGRLDEALLELERSWCQLLGPCCRCSGAAAPNLAESQRMAQWNRAELFYVTGR